MTILMNSLGTVHHGRFFWLSLLAASLLLTGWPGTRLWAQRAAADSAEKANQGDAVKPLSTADIRKLQDQAVQQIREYMVELDRQIDKTKRREKEADAQAELQRLNLRKSYYQGFLNKMQALREIETLQQKLAQAGGTVSGEELDKQIAQLMALSGRYQEALKLIASSNTEFQRLQGELLMDPVTVVMQRRADNPPR
jgi:predicted phage gp36 major capsid-like protein